MGFWAQLFDLSGVGFVLAVAVVAIISVALCFACGARIKHCCTKKTTVLPTASARYKVAIAPFYKAHPIALPKPTLDLEAPLRFHLFDYDRIVPVGRFYYKGTRLVFDPKRQGKRSPTAAAAQRKAEKLALADARRAKKSGGKPGESLVSKSRTITVQTNRVLAGPSPDVLSTTEPVYYEVSIDFVGIAKASKATQYMPQPAEIAIGWAAAPYPPFEMVGSTKFSLALHCDGHVMSSRATSTDTVMLYPDGFAQGDVVGAGYELRKDAGVIEFFFTVNGTRLDPLPNDWGVFELPKARRYFNAGEKYYAAKTPKRSSKKRPKKPPQGRVGDHVLAGGAAFPTISCAGPAALEPKFSGPFMYTPYLAMLTPTAGKRSRRRSETVATRIVAEKHRNAAIMKAGGVSPAAGRRYSVAEGAGMAKWDHFLHHQAATTGAEARLQATSPTKKGRRLSLPLQLRSSPASSSEDAQSNDGGGSGGGSGGGGGVAQGFAVPTEEERALQALQDALSLKERRALEAAAKAEKAAARAAMRERWKRRLSAPTALLGEAVKGWAQRAAAVKVTQRSPVHRRLSQVVGDGIAAYMDSREAEDRDMNPPGESQGEQKPAGSPMHLDRAERVAAAKLRVNAAKEVRRARRASLKSPMALGASAVAAAADPRAGFHVSKSLSPLGKPVGRKKLPPLKPPVSRGDTL